MTRPRGRPHHAREHAAQRALRLAHARVGAALGTSLRRLHGGAIGEPDWMHADALLAAALTLPAAPGAAPQAFELLLNLQPGVPARALPRTLTLGPGHPPLRLRCRPGAPAIAQGVPRVGRASAPFEQGTATCLVRDRLSPDRHYLVSCGHVLAPSIAARWGDLVELSNLGGPAPDLVSRLREWQPTLGAGAPPSQIDAALAELDSAAVGLLRQHAADWIPARIDDTVPLDREVHLRRFDGDLSGALKLHWSGRIVLPDGHDADDYFLRDAVGYTTSEPTRGGDSGAPVWTGDHALLGMHIAAIEPELSFGANAVLGRIAPVLDWYQVQPYTRDDPAAITAPMPGVGPRQLPGQAAPLTESAIDAVRVVAQTLWGEARGEGQAGMEAVASVVANRLRRQYRGRKTAVEVCLDPQQFSCWNSNDPNRLQMEALAAGSADPVFQVALRVAGSALGGGLPDPTRGALHYVSRTLRLRPGWLDGKSPCAVIGNHEFYNDIA